MAHNIQRKNKTTKRKFSANVADSVSFNPRSAAQMASIDFLAARRRDDGDQTNFCTTLHVIRFPPYPSLSLTPFIPSSPHSLYGWCDGLFLFRSYCWCSPCHYQGLARQRQAYIYIYIWRRRHSKRCWVWFGFGWSLTAKVRSGFGLFSPAEPAQLSQFRFSSTEALRSSHWKEHTFIYMVNPEAEWCLVGFFFGSWPLSSCENYEQETTYNNSAVLVCDVRKQHAAKTGSSQTGLSIYFLRNLQKKCF